MLGYIGSRLCNNMVYYLFTEILKLPLTVNNFSHPIECLDYYYFLSIQLYPLICNPSLPLIQMAEAS